MKKFESSQWPRAALAVDTSEVAPVTMQGPTLLAGDDPYEAIGSTFRPRTLAKAGNQTEPGLDPDKPIKRAIPVVPTPDPTIEVRRAAARATDRRIRHRTAPPKRTAGAAGFR